MRDEVAVTQNFTLSRPARDYYNLGLFSFRQRTLGTAEQATFLRLKDLASLAKPYSVACTGHVSKLLNHNFTSAIKCSHSGTLRSLKWAFICLSERPPWSLAKCSTKGETEPNTSQLETNKMEATSHGQWPVINWQELCVHQSR